MRANSILPDAAGDGLTIALAAVHHSEGGLVHALLDLSDRHATEHEIHFVARDLASWSREHVRRLAELGTERDLDLDREPGHEHAWAAALKRSASEILGRRRAPAALLLADLRALHREIAGVSLDWEILAQAAQAAEEKAMVDLVSACHPQTLRQLRWTNAQVKELAPQIVNSL
jgi:hypothetical protein